MQDNIREHRSCTLTLSGGIMRWVYRADAEVTLDDAKETVALAGEMGTGRYPTLVDISRIRSVTAAARKFYSGPETKQVELATALLVSSAVSRVIGNFYLRLNKPDWPTRLFTSEHDALAWLTGFIEESPPGDRAASH